MARLSDGGTGSRIIVTPRERATTEAPWSSGTYPRPDPSYGIAEGTEVTVSHERLYWRSSGVLAYGADKPHPVDEEPLLWTWAEMTTPPDTLPDRKKKGR